MNELREKLQEEPLINNIKEEVDKILLKSSPNSNINKCKRELTTALMILAEGCGCIDDIKNLEKTLDELFEKKIINTNDYEEIIRKTACNRWL